MADNDTSAQAATDDAATQAAADDTQQDTTQQAQQGTSTDTAQTGDSDQVKALRAEAAARRKELRDTQAELKKLQDAQLSDQQKLEQRAADAEKRVTELQATTRDALLRARVTAEAALAGVTDVDAARLLLPSVGQVEYDEDSGEPTNVADLVKSLVEAKPYLVGQQDDPPRDPRTQRTTPAQPKRSAGRFTRQQVAAMTPKEIAALSPDDYAAAVAAMQQ